MRKLLLIFLMSFSGQAQVKTEHRIPKTLGMRILKSMDDLCIKD